MRIGVMTFWWSEDNYGQLLQCYALQKYLRDLGHDAYLIRYLMPRGKLTIKERILKYFVNPLHLIFAAQRVVARWRHRKMPVDIRRFNAFRKRYLRVSEIVYHSLAELRSRPPEADMYVVGSDQVWNLEKGHGEDVVAAMFLDFGRSTIRRVSYAASFGRTDFQPAVECWLRKYISKLDAISVREESGLAVCKRLCGKTPIWVCDPTFLIGLCDYRRIMLPLRRKRKYIFCYMLTNSCRFDYQLLAQYAARNDFDIVYVPGNDEGYSRFNDDCACKTYLSIEEWISGICDAQFVVTNSFHCCVISAIFEKKTGVILLDGDAKAMNARIFSLDAMLQSPIPHLTDGDFDVVLNSTPIRLLKGVSCGGEKYIRENIEAVAMQRKRGDL